MYDLIEEKVFANEKSIEKSFASNFETSINEKSIEKLSIEKFIDQSNIMQQILKTYFQDDVFQRVMKAKRSNQRKISIDLVRKEFKLKLNDCELNKKNLSEESHLCSRKEISLRKSHQANSWVIVRESCKTRRDLWQN